MSKQINLSADPRRVILILLVLIMVMLALWQPWKSTSAPRKITVAGHSRIKAQPDFYQFNPSYQRLDADRDKALNELNTHVKDVTQKLKELGVDEKDIGLTVNSYDQYYPDKTNQEKAVTAQLSIKAANKDLAQKIQDYLLTTSPEGNITPTPSFSDDQREKLENEARGKAITDAATQAERTARQLSAKLGKVLEVRDTVAGGIVPFERGIAVDAKAEDQSLPIFPGEQEISFSVEVVFEIK